MADVRIKIDIDADTSAIDRVRIKMRQLCNEVDSCTEVQKKHSKALSDLAREQKRVGDGADDNGNAFSKLTKFGKGLLGGLKSLGMLGFKYVAIEAAAALLVIGSAGLLFKAGKVLAKGYQAALSGVAYAMAAIVAAGSAFLAAQREFQAVQFAPAYAEGAINTTSNIAAASGAMKMFVDDAQLAVIGAKGLSSAFKTLSDQAPVTGQTTAVFRELSDYTTGVGGDLEKGSQALAKFLAQYQKDKTMTSAVKKAGEELGPEFKKILEEANKMGVNTYEEFSAAAIKGELGTTFEKYDGQLQRVNSTLIGVFKTSFAEIKSFLVEIGEPLLQPIKEQVPRLMNIIKALLIQIRGNVTEIGSGSLLTGFVDVVDKMAKWIGRLAGGDLGKAGMIIDGMRKSWDFLVRGFEMIQDYLRPLQEAASALWEVLKPILNAFSANFDSTINNLSDSLVNNKDKWMAFSEGIASLLDGVGDFGNSLKNTLVNIMPSLGSLAKTLGNTFRIMGSTLEAASPVLNVLLTIANAILKIFNMIASVVGVTLGKLTGGLSSIITLVGSLMLLGKGKALLGGKGGVGAKAFDFLFKKDPVTGARGMTKVGNAIKGGAKTAGGKIVGASNNILGKAGNVATRLGSKGPVPAGGAAAALGTTAIVAGSAYAGNKVGGFVSDKLFNDDSVLSKTGGAATGAVSGGATGAAIGAGIGAMFGGVSAAPGAVIGAVVGSIFGGVSGWLKAGKEKKEARKAANELMDTYTGSMSDAIANGDIEALLGARDAAMERGQEIASSNKYGAKEMAKRESELKKLNKQVDTYVTNAGNFEALSGMDTDKMNEFLKEIYGSEEAAAEAAKNGVLNVFDIMRAGGIDVGEQWRGLMSEFNQSLIEQRLALFDIPMQMLETQKAVDAAQRKLLEGDTSTEAVTDFLKKAYEYALSQTGGDALAATDFMREHLDKAYGPGGSLERVANEVKDGAENLKLFDPETLINQITQSGMLQTQGRAIEAISGGKISAGVAELQLRSLIGNSGDPAGTATLINEIMNAGVTGKIKPEQLMAYLFTGQSGLDMGGKELTKIADQEALTLKLDKMYADAGYASTGAVIPNQIANLTSVGNITVEVSGFISDPTVAAMIANTVYDEINKRDARRGVTGPQNAPAGGR